ncbi:MAG: hypothetical protein MJ229_04850 [bacterium]|nr:hypothetical protein [bacterium]
MENSILKDNNSLTPSIFRSVFSTENESFTSLSTAALLAKSDVPYSHKKLADNYVLIKKIYKFHVLQSRISNQEVALLKKYDLNVLECSTIKQINEELSFLKKWSYSQNEELRDDADKIIEIRAKELKYLAPSSYVNTSNEVYDGYRALEKYFEEISNL